MWDNTMEVKSDEIDNNTFDQINLDKNLQTAKKEGNKTIANNLICNPIDDNIDIMNKQREHVNIKLIDESIKKNDQSHQKVDNTTGQGAKISLLLNKNSFADVFDSQGSSISLLTDNDIIDRVVTRRK